ncbi:MAG TPA: MFS transporter [Acidimicrobiales bacterium]|jgi:MFS family permease|nr:MFS transporter [Acidimicrobiales bacterium]
MPEAGPLPAAEIPPTTAKRSSSFRALHSKPFRLYFGGQVVSASGSFLQQTAIGWLVLERTGSPGDLGLVLAAGGIPSLLLGPWGGAVADRVDLRKLLVVTQTLYGLLAGLLWGLAAAGRASVTTLVVIGVVGGFIQIADSPARQAFVSRLVPPEDLSSAVSLNGVVVNSARVVGPALAGVLIVTAGTTVCFGLNALTYLAVIAALLVIRPTKADGTSPPGRQGVREGMRYAAGRQQLWLPLLMMLVVGLLAFNFAVVLPVLAKDTFHGSGGTYGLLSTMLSIGAILGSLGVGLVRHPKRQYLLFAALGFGVTSAASAAAPNVAVACVTLLFMGATAFCFVTMCSTTLQLHSSSAYRGRIMALWVFVYLGTTPIGSILTGWIISASGPREALLVGSGACLAAAVLAAFVHTPPHPDDALADLTR